MDFPEGQPVGKRERSVAERHRAIVLCASIATLLPVAYVVGLIVTFPPLRLLSTLFVSFALIWVLTHVLRRRFMLQFVREDLVLRPTVRPPSKPTAGYINGLSAQGFACVETAVVAGSSGAVFTRPIAIMQRPGDGLVAYASSLGASAVTSLDDGSVLHTSTTDVVGHPSLRIVQLPQCGLDRVISEHLQALVALGHQGIQPTEVAPGQLVLGIERMEQDTIASLRARGITAPSTRELVNASD